MKHFLFIVTFLFSASVFSAPKSELWPYWNVSNEESSRTVSHAKWQSFLDSYLTEEGENTLVKYNKVTKEDKALLSSYISELADLDPRGLSRAEQYAYWVNLYNALTVQLILDSYPVKSITKLGGLFSFGPWGDEIITVEGKKLTLNDIEHRILRPIWNDPRTHYAVNCASLGCPNLQPLAFTTENTEMLLEHAAGSFINSRKGVSLSGKRTELSSIYDWFSEDFGTSQELMKHLKKYRPSLSFQLSKAKYDYNWDLNDAK